jgi:hypothetical protein
MDAEEIEGFCLCTSAPALALFLSCGYEVAKQEDHKGVPVYAMIRKPKPRTG